jgi:ornithine carbamoyltransferase
VHGRPVDETRDEQERIRLLKSLLRAADLSRRDVTWILDAADQYRVSPLRNRKLLRGRAVICHFATPSVRTRISSETAITHLGGTPLVVGPADLDLGRTETIGDTARILSRYGAAILVRTFDDADVQGLARAASIPVVNALTERHHPCQSLADLAAVRQRFGSLHKVRIAFVGDASSSVAHSLIEACSAAGVDIRVAAPPGYEPDSTIVAGAREVAARHGSHLLLTHDPVEAVAGAHVVYTDPWVPATAPAKERERRLAALRPYQVNQRLFDRRERDGILLHSLPAHRGEEVTADVIASRASWVFVQAEYRLWTMQAVLEGLLLRQLRGSRTTRHADATE